MYLEIRYHLGLCGPSPACRYHEGDDEDADGNDDDGDDADDDAADGDGMNERNGQ